MVRNHKVRGSIPLFSIKNDKALMNLVVFLLPDCKFQEFSAVLCILKNFILYVTILLFCNTLFL